MYILTELVYFDGYMKTKFVKFVDVIKFTIRILMLISVQIVIAGNLKNVMTLSVIIAIKDWKSHYLKK